MGHQKDGAAPKEAAALSDVASAIKKDFPHLADDDVAAMVDRAREDFHHRPIREFVPLFVERRIRAQLTTQQE
ncbi:three-helix bundle dimerization domain-containing protein [Rhodococcus gannanensis]|uniref:Three-helix bundle dimerization domain-containing protein n=1 Tax=Rhodococcus gannanensis TaxID=1960308 RepID=A0ABW4PAB6_9NOCA